jgi:hypothetical protein
VYLSHSVFKACLIGGWQEFLPSTAVELGIFLMSGVVLLRENQLMKPSRRRVEFHDDTKHHPWEEWTAVPFPGSMN